MARRRIICPECGHTHYTGVSKTIAGVRSKRLTSGQFEYTGIMPGHLSFDDDEIEQFYTIGEQALFMGLVGIVAGSLVGFLVSQPFPVEYSLRIIPAFVLGGVTVAECALASERSTQLRRALPWFADIATKIKPPASDNEVTLTVDHRYRDGKTESGRTINRFGALPVDLTQFNEWAQSALIGKSLGIAHWTPKAKGFTRQEYDQLLTKMTGGGIIINLGSNKGNVLTGGGRRTLSRHLSDCGITPPSPASEDDFLKERLDLAQANNGGNTPLPRSGVCAGGENG